MIACSSSRIAVRTLLISAEQNEPRRKPNSLLLLFVT
jgi:hypothetical protein